MEDNKNLLTREQVKQILEIIKEDHELEDEKTLMMKVKYNSKKFMKKTFYRLLGRIIELSVLFGIGYSLGLKLIRY